MTEVNKTKSDWQAYAKAIEPETRAFINGEYTKAQSGETFDCLNPATGKVICKVSACDATDVNIAVEGARAAFEDGRWRHQSPKKRKQVMQKFGQLIRENTEELALLETLDMGKPINDSLTVDVPLAAECLEWFGELLDKVYDEVAPTGDNAFATITREPIGVVAAVVPWNFPLLMAAWKIGPALAAGNSLVLKPAEQSSLTAIKLGQLALEAGIPVGVFNVVPGMGETAGKAIGLHNDVDAVTFTGSGEVGKFFLGYSAQSNMKRISLECGGKSPNIIFPDVKDLDKAASGAAWAIFYNQGEVCNAGSRLLVHESIKDKVLKKLFEVADTIQPGDPLDPATKMGAIVDQAQTDKILSYIAKGKEDGCEIVYGGNKVLTETGGNFIEPTVFDKVNNQHTIAREEIFGPVLSVLTFKTVEEAVAIANDTDFGLAAAIWTDDIKLAHVTSKKLRAGTVWINCFDHGSITVPFGGYKQSGFGRDKSIHAFDKYCETKTTWLDLGN